MEELKEMHANYNELFSFDKELEITELVDKIVDNREYYYKYPEKIYEYINNFIFQDEERYRCIGLSERYIISLYIINIIEIIRLKKENELKKYNVKKSKITLLERIRKNLDDIVIVKSVSD